MSLTVRIGDCVGGHLAMTHYAPGETCHAHRHDGAQVSLVLSGDYREDGSTGRIWAYDGVLTGKPAGFEHENVFGAAGALILSVNLHEAPFLKTYFADLGGPEGAAVLLAGAEAGQLAGMVGSKSRIMAALEPRSTAASSWLEAAYGRLSAEGRTRNAELARSAGKHPVTFGRMIRTAFGRSPAAIRQAGRMARALEAIIRSRTPMIEIALETGFADQAHMSRHVRQATGYSPLRLRRLFSSD